MSSKETYAPFPVCAERLSFLIANGMVYYIFYCLKYDSAKKIYVHDH